MINLHIDPPVPFVLPPGPLLIVLVGCGGTGSHLAQALARMAWHAQEQGITLRLVFVDGDHVEHKNVGRQLFSPADVGKNKAEVLAARFNAVWGLRIEAVPQMLTPDLVRTLETREAATRILVGAVDNAHARRALLQGMKGTWTHPRWKLWLDCGNHEHAGQVLVGSAADPESLRGAFALGGVCTALPAPSLVAPELLRQRDAQPRMDCAAAMEDNRQSLLVNQMIASIAAEYLHKLVFARRITTWQTTVDLATLSMRSTPITAANVAQALAGEVSVDQLIHNVSTVLTVHMEEDHDDDDDTDEL